VLTIKNYKIYILIAVIFIFILCFIGSKGELVENLQIPVGVGNDTDPINTYKVPFLVYSFEEEGKISSNIVIGEGKSIGDTRENRQLKSGTRSAIGLTRIFVFSEASATFGLRNFIDICINNPQINDRAICVICKGKAEDILKYNVEGYANSAEYIEKMINNLQQYNFYPMQYTLIDFLVRVDAEGRNALLPLIKIKDTSIETIGLAIFKKDKLVGKADVDEARIINILKENNIKISMSERANPYDNAKMESFFRTLKVEEVYMFEYDSFEDALQGLTRFIEKVYNSKRLHSSLGYLSPEEFENKFNNNKIRTRQLVLT